MPESLEQRKQLLDEFTAALNKLESVGMEMVSGPIDFFFKADDEEDDEAYDIKGRCNYGSMRCNYWEWFTSEGAKGGPMFYCKTCAEKRGQPFESAVHTKCPCDGCGADAVVAETYLSRLMEQQSA